MGNALKPNIKNELNSSARLRGGSESFFHKNIKPIFNKQYIYITINAPNPEEDVYFLGGEYDHINNKYNTSFQGLEHSQLFIDLQRVKYTNFYRFKAAGTHFIIYQFDDCLYNCSYMFSHCTSITNIKFVNFISDKITDMNNMFSFCTSLSSLDLSTFATKNVTKMNEMFYFCEQLSSLNLSNFNTENVTDMESMFYGCTSLSSVNLSSFNTSKVVNMSSMFYECKSLKILDLSSFSGESLKNYSNIFLHCNSLLSLNLSSFNIDFHICGNKIFNDHCYLRAVTFPVNLPFNYYSIKHVISNFAYLQQIVINGDFRNDLFYLQEYVEPSEYEGIFVVCNQNDNKIIKIPKRFKRIKILI